MAPVSPADTNAFSLSSQITKDYHLLWNEPDEIETLYIRIKYVPSTQSEQCIIYHWYLMMEKNLVTFPDYTADDISPRTIDSLGH